MILLMLCEEPVLMPHNISLAQ